MTENTSHMLADSAPVAAHNPPAAWRADPKLSEKWKFRFDFFERHGAPTTSAQFAAFVAALKPLSLRQRSLIRMNFYAFFFSFIYYGFFLKLWRQALMLLGLALVVGVVCGIFDASDSIFRGASMGVGFVAAFRANVLYYLKRTQGDIGWKV